MKQLSIRHTSIVNIIRLQLHDQEKIAQNKSYYQEKIAQNKSYEKAYNYKQCKVAERVARNSQWENCFGGLGAEPLALENFAFFSKII